MTSSAISTCIYSWPTPSFLTNAHANFSSKKCFLTKSSFLSSCMSRYGVSFLAHNLWLRLALSWLTLAESLARYGYCTEQLCNILVTVCSCNRLSQPPDDATLSGMVPTVWWPPSPASKEATPLAANYEPKDEDERRRKAEYEEAVEALKAKIKVVHRVLYLTLYLFSNVWKSSRLFLVSGLTIICSHFTGFGGDSDGYSDNVVDWRRCQ